MIDDIPRSDVNAFVKKLGKDEFLGERVIGSFLRDILVCSDAKVHGLDNLSTDLMHDIGHLLNADRIIVKESDVTHPYLRGLILPGLNHSNGARFKGERGSNRTLLFSSTLNRFQVIGTCRKLRFSA